IPAAPDPAQVGRPALIGCACHRRQRLDPWALANRPLAYLPALELEDALHGVLVHAQQPGYGAVAERRLLLDQLLDRLGQLRPHLRRGLGGPVIHRPPRPAEPAAQLGDRNLDPFVLQSLPDRASALSALPSRDSQFVRATG